MAFHKTTSATRAIHHERVSATVRMLVPMSLVALLVAGVIWCVHANARDNRSEIHVKATVETIHPNWIKGFVTAEWTGTVSYRDLDGEAYVDGVQFWQYAKPGTEVDVQYRAGHPEDVYMTNDAKNFLLYAFGLGLVAAVVALFAIPPAVRLVRLGHNARSLRTQPYPARFDWWLNHKAGASRDRAALGSLQAEDRFSWGPVTVPLGGSPPIDPTPTYSVMVYGDDALGPTVIVGDDWTIVIKT